MTVKEFLATTIKSHKYPFSDEVIQENRPRLLCNDGFSISVQASKFHYCRPRLDGIQDYEAVELGYPSNEDELINDYAEDYDYTTSAYVYVPIEVVATLIVKHGVINIYQV